MGCRPVNVRRLGWNRRLGRSGRAKVVDVVLGVRADDLGAPTLWRPFLLYLIITSLITVPTVNFCWPVGLWKAGQGYGLAVGSPAGDYGAP